MINEVFMLSDIFKLDKEKLNKTGIYCIFNVKNDKYYIGQTNSSKKYGGLFKRLKTHITNLRGGYHDNIFLQRAFNKYGENYFRFQILEICSEKDLNEREIYWGAFYNSLSPYGYNFILGEQNGSISSCFKQKLSENRPDISGYNNPKCKWIKIDDFGGVNKIINLKNSGLSKGEIVNMIGISKHSFDNYLSYQGLSWQKIGEYNTLDEKIDYLGGIDKIINLKESGRTQKDVSLFFNVHSKTIGSFLKKNNTKWSDLGKYGDNTSFYRIDAMGGIRKIVKLKESGKSKKDVCLFFNVGLSTLESFLKKNSVKWSNLGKYNTLDEKIDYLGGIKKIDMLIEKGYTQKEISDIMKVSTTTLRRYIDFHKTPKKGRVLNN